MGINSRHVVNSSIIKENENAAHRTFEQGDFVLCFLLSHSLIESLLRAFFEQSGNESFNDLIIAFDNFMKSEGQTDPVFVKELTEFNRRRNRVIHQLWKDGYSGTNEKLEAACRTAFIIFGLLIEWIETYDTEIKGHGFEYEK